MIFGTHMITPESDGSKPQWFTPETTLTTLITTKWVHEDTALLAGGHVSIMC